MHRKPVFTGKYRCLHGLSVLVDGGKKIDRILYREGDRRNESEYLTEFDEHPFGLDSPESSRVYFIGFPNYSDSVEAFAAYVAEHLTRAPIDTEVGLLRIIEVEGRGEFKNDHEIYFEIWLGQDVYIVGGCTDCSGAGGSAKESLDCFFEVLSVLTHLEIEKKSIPYAAGEAAKEKIFEVIEN